MPKISDLTAAATLTGAELIPLVQAGTTKRSTVAAMGASGYYNVKSYGALGDGSTNDTAAINSAIAAAVAAGGGTVFIPRGTYIIQPSASQTSYDSTGFALHVTGNNVRIVGDGWPGGTKLQLKMYNGNAATTVPPPLVGGAVMRGDAIRIETQSGFQLRDIEIDGGAGDQGNVSFPADPVTGDGWDITHHAVYPWHDVAHDLITIDNCWLHTFRGEIVTTAGISIQKVTVRNCKIGDTNANAINVPGHNLEVVGNELYTCTNGGTENVYFTGRAIYARNYIHGCGKGFIVYPALGPYTSNTYAINDIYDNQIVSCTIGLYIPGANNMRVYDNYFVDCSYGMYFPSGGLGGDGLQFIQAANVKVYNNHFMLDGASSNTSGSAFFTSLTSSAPGQDIWIDNNTFSLSSIALNGSKTMRAVLEAAQETFQPSFRRIRMRSNEGYTNLPGNVLSDTGGSELIDLLLSATTETSVLFINDDRDYLRTIDIFYEVKNATTNLTLKIKFHDDTTNVVWTPISVAAQAVGLYSVSYNVSPHYGFNTTRSLELTAQAGTANNITISARVRD